MRNNSQFKLYVRSTGHNLVHRLRKISQNSNTQYEKYYNQEFADVGECSKTSDDNVEPVAPLDSNIMLRRVSISKRKRRSKNSVYGFTKLYDVEEEENEEDEMEMEILRKTSMEVPSMMSLSNEDRVQGLDEDLAVLEEKGYYMESDIEEEDDNESDQNSAGSNADYEDSSSDGY